MLNETVLIAEDDESLLETIAFNVENTGRRALRAVDGATAVDICVNEDVCVMLLDIGLPVMNGLDVCKTVRGYGITTPIIMLTALTRESQRIDGLKAGADDYMSKPFSIAELMARINAQFRRIKMVNNKTSHIINVGDMEIDQINRVVKVMGNEIGLAMKEYEILNTLAAQPGRIFTRRQIWRSVYKDEAYGNEYGSKKNHRRAHLESA